MKSLKTGEPSTEVNCPACGGTGFSTVAQPAKPSRRIYPAPCKQCSGKAASIRPSDTEVPAVHLLLVNSRRVATISAGRYGLVRNRLPSGKSCSPTLTKPEVGTISIGGHRARTNLASFSPSMEPGIWMSVKTT